MVFLRGFLAILLLVNHAATRPPTAEIQTGNHNIDHHPAIQDGAHTSVHEMGTEETTDEGDPFLNKEMVLETNQDEEIEEEPEEEAFDEEGIPADKRGGSMRRTHGSRRNHTVIEKRSDRSSEEDKLEMLNPDHVIHKRSPHEEDCLHEHDRRKRSSAQATHEEENDGSFDGLEYEDLQKEAAEREKRSHQHHEQEEEAEELSNFPSDSAQHVQPVALRVKRVSKAGSSHRNRLLTKNKGNSKAGQGEDEQQPPVMIEPIM